MKVIKPPKGWPPDSGLQLLLEKFKTTDSKHGYVHWDKLMHLPIPEPFNSNEEYWHAIKASRRTQYKNLPFTENFVYLLTDYMQEKLHLIDSKMHGTVGAANIEWSNNSKIYLKRSLIEEAIRSSKLEGASTTHRVALEMLKTNSKPKNHSEQMIYNNYQAMLFVNEHKYNDITPQLILELHQIVSHNTLDDPADCGRLRTDDDVLVIDSRDNKISHTPPGFNTLPDRIKLLCEFANLKTPDFFVHPIIRAIVVHLILAYDHPFVDGNGRTARALFYWIMAKNNYWFFQYLSISNIIKNAPAKYSKAFLYVETDELDTTYFLHHQLDTICKAIKSFEYYLERKYNQLKQTQALLQNHLSAGKINPRQMLLIQHALKNPGYIYKIEGHKQIHGVSYQTAKTDLTNLAKLDLLHQSKQSRAFIFISPADLHKRIDN